jgi:hypothetical protein
MCLRELRFGRLRLQCSVYPGLPLRAELRLQPILPL